VVSYVKPLPAGKDGDLDRSVNSSIALGTDSVGGADLLEEASRRGGGERRAAEFCAW
jgi:hypothetical protein